MKKSFHSQSSVKLKHVSRARWSQSGVGERERKREREKEREDITTDQTKFQRSQDRLYAQGTPWRYSLINEHKQLWLLIGQTSRSCH